MSYILEALKKSEQQRGSDSTPTVQTIHSASLQYTQQKKPLWPYVLAAVITLNVIALIVFFAPPRTSDKPVPQDPPAATPAAFDAQRGAVVTATTPTPATVPGNTATTPQGAAAAGTTTPQQNPEPGAFVVDLRDLPLHIQRQIPDMVFSAHVYSRNPAQRSVVINGDFMEQGDMLNARLRLEEITADGVIFDYAGTRFRSSVLTQWKID